MRLASLLASLALAATAAAPGIADARKVMTVEADVVKQEKTDDGATLITVGRGLEGRLTKTSHCALVDPKGEAVSNDCAIIRVDKTQTVVKTHAKLLVPVRVRFWF